MIDMLCHLWTVA